MTWLHIYIAICISMTCQHLCLSLLYNDSFALRIAYIVLWPIYMPLGVIAIVNKRSRNIIRLQSAISLAHVLGTHLCDECLSQKDKPHAH